MSGTYATDTTIPFGALPPDAPSTADLATLQEKLRLAGEIVREVGILATLATLGATDPATARDQLERAAEMHWAAPPLLPALHDAMLDLMRRRVEGADRTVFMEPAPVTSARLEVDRVEAFRRWPGHYVPNAVHARGIASIGPAAVDGFLDIAGEICPWAYSACGVGKSGVWELAQSFAAFGCERGYIVGTHLREGVVLPAGVVFVEML